MQKIGQAVYGAQGAPEGSGPGPEPEVKAHEEGTVEGEFREV